MVSGNVIQCVSVGALVLPSSDGRLATGNFLTFESGEGRYEYEGDNYTHSARCRYLYEIIDTGDLVHENGNQHYNVIFIVQKIVKNYRRGLITRFQMVDAFSDIGISEEYIDNWLLKLDEYRLL